MSLGSMQSDGVVSSDTQTAGGAEPDIPNDSSMAKLRELEQDASLEKLEEKNHIDEEKSGDEDGSTLANGQKTK